MSYKNKSSELPTKIFTLLILLALTGVLLTKFMSPTRGVSLNSEITKLNDFKETQPLPYKTLIKKLLKEGDKLNNQTFSATLKTNNGSLIKTDYNRGLVHTELYNTQSLTDENKIIGLKNHRYDLYSLPSDGEFLKNRTIICDFSIKVYPCRDLTIALLGIPGLYFQTELYTEVFGIDINTISGVLGVGNFDPGFWKIMTKDLANPTNFKSDTLDETAKLMLSKRHAYQATQITKNGKATCYGFAEEDLRTIKNPESVKGWCWRDGIYLWSPSGSTNQDKVIKLTELNKFPLPRDILLEKASKVLTEPLAKGIEAKGVASEKFVMSLKTKPNFNSYIIKPKNN